MPSHVQTRFEFTGSKPSRQEIAGLHAALGKLRLEVAPEELRTAELGKTTRAAIRRLQDRAGLPASGRMSAPTVKAIQAELEHTFFTANKTRTARVHDLLERTGFAPTPDERKARAFGTGTEKALRAFQKQAGVERDGRMSEALLDRLEADALKARFTTKTQVADLHRKLLRVNRIGSLGAAIDPAEIKARELGATTKETIRAFQKRYGLDATGELDVATFERMTSVAASRPARVPMLAVRSAQGLAPVRRALRLNMTNEQVGDLQRTLAFLGFRVARKEFDTRTYGKTTRQAVLEFQRSRGLAQTGQVEAATLGRLNAELARAQPLEAAPPAASRVRGSVRDDLWRGRPGLKVQVLERTLRGDDTLLGERKTFENGFFDIPYQAPRNPVDGTIKTPFQLRIRVVGQDGAELDSKVAFNPTPIWWVNFTDGAEPYRGTSDFETRMQAVSGALDGVAISELRETDAEQDLTYVALHSGLSPEDVMRLVLAHLAAEDVGDAALPPEVFYAFVRQSLPPSLPSDLIASTVGWTLIDALVDLTVQDIVFMPAGEQSAALDQAVAENLIPIGVGSRRQQALDALAARQVTFALEKPILVGNGSLKGLLETSSVPPASYPKVAAAFLAHGGLGNPFWADVRGRPAEFGGATAVADFEATAQLGTVAKHHQPTLDFIKAAIADPGNDELTAASDTAKLDHAQWVGLIQQNGGQVPDSIEGATPQARIDVYAASLAAQSERVFPSIALAAEVARSQEHGLGRIADVQQLLDEHADLDLSATNLDGFVRDEGLAVDPDVLAETKVLQRVQRIASNAATGQALLDEKLHHSAQVVFLGKERLAANLEARGVDTRTALTVFGQAELQYAQVLARLGEFRLELHRADPAAIVSHTYTPQEQQELLGEFPNLEALFGSLDFCDCAHCQSVYSPSAYLADTLRFLDSHLSEDPPRTVRDILLERRPDIANVKLNCENTETSLPYIDLVCEVLEGAVPAPFADPDFSFQTTRTAAELRAFPENVRTDAYDVLREADFPMSVAFDLWQEEARVWLDHLGVPRHQLMETLQARPDGADPTPSDASIAGEYWELSPHETGLVVTPDADPARQETFWGFDCTRAEVGVEEILEHARIEYLELLALVHVRWLNAPGAPGDIALARPGASCDLALQSVTNLTVARFDRIHRFLRLWRRTGWKLWELDKLVRAPLIGNGEIDADALAHLHRFRKVQKLLGLPFETALALYDGLDTEVRTQPDDSQKTIQPLYHQLYQNPAVTDPVDTAFALPLGGGQTLAGHKATLLAALGVSDADLTRLIDRTDGGLTLANLARLYAALALARGLNTTVERLLQLEDMSGSADVLASPQDTLDFLELYGWAAGSGLELDELDFLLEDRPDSPYGLRDEAITRLVESLRDARRSATGDESNAIVAEIASAFSLPPDQARSLLAKLSLDDTLLAELADPELTERELENGNEVFGNPIDPIAFKGVYDTYRLLHKVSLVLRRQKLATLEDLNWLLDNHAAFGLLDLGALPVRAQPAVPLFPAWLRLTKWLYLRARFPEPEATSLRAIFELAAQVDGAGAPSTPIATLRAAIEELTRWTVADLEALHDALELKYDAARNDYTSVETYVRLAQAFRAIRRLGVEAALAAGWVNRDAGPGAQALAAQQIRAAAKAKYDHAIWLSRAAPLEDVVRERKRAALVAYLVEHSQRNQPEQIDFGGKSWANPRRWTDSNDLLRYFLIDVEMSSCQLTSRIKQAMGSVQMFVQRCFLNLELPFVQVGREEKEDTASLNSWRQWRYMQSYRLWEAARKVFLYPENWILPELRDDKSPFFKELEDELLQGELTNEHAETAFRHYLEKVHEVSRLDVLGVYHEVDDDDPRDNLPPNINLLHVVARTWTDPAVYYYRRFDLNYGTWSAWEKIDVDITGDHLLPVVYNRKLYLFWLVFVEKPQKALKQPPAQTSSKTDAEEPPRQLELQLGWSVRMNGGWTSKKVSRQKLIHPWERPLESYHLKSRYKVRENLLWLDVYISTSRQFNNTKFYDPFKDAREYLTAFRFDETSRPWHSSSFVFDGGVVDLKLKPLRGFYHLPDLTGSASDATAYASSYDYVHGGGFGEGAREISPLQGPYEIAPRLPLPDGMHYRLNRLANNTARPNANRLNVLELGGVRTLLQGARAPFELVFSQDQIRFDTGAFGAEPLLYQDRQRSFFVRSDWQTVVVGYNQVVQRLRYRFYPFYHPYSALFLRELNRSGVDGLLTRRIQRFPASYYPGSSFDFATYGPVAPNQGDASAQREIVDFDQFGAYSIYNWETFFHAPLLIASRLSQNQRFEEAMKWFHYIFDPANVDALASPQRFWVTRPFFEQNSDDYRRQRIENLLRDLGANLDQIRAWKNDPFNPHLIARYRPIAYQKNVVMKYIDNLIAWGDQLFRQDTLESINQATLRYVLAYELLGRRPARVPSPGRDELSYNELLAQGELDPLGNQSILAQLENLAAPPDVPARTQPDAEPLPLLDPLYFCIPPNDMLLGYWNTVEDRLFKIRHCMNIEGVVRQLPLFEPPIDPALLVKAAAAGVDIGSILDPTDVDPGQYRYRLLVAKAAEYCAEVRALGEKLLSVLEKQDAEALSLLRSANEIQLFEATRQVRRNQIAEAEETLAGLEQARIASERQLDYYRGREFINAWEGTALGLSTASAVIETAIATAYILSGGLKLIPDFVAGASGFGGSPHVVSEITGGDKIGDAAEAAAQTLRSIGAALDKYASLASTMGSYARRQDEWELQGDLAEIEIRQFDNQIEAARLRQAVAERELENLELQIEQSTGVDEYLRSKYTNRELYDWMLRQLTTIYFLAYKLAFDMARRAEKACQFELGRPELSFIEFGYWDSLKRGLLSAEKLGNDIRRMETAYLEGNGRELELTKHVSLAQFMPLSLLALRTAGECTVRVPEWLYDLDYPGHYRRRIKSVAITIPSVVGPYTGIHATVALVRNGVRVDDSVDGGYGDPLGAAPDPRFATNRVPVDSIATSHGQNDAGLFELSFNDERYLPFEGAGAVSEWHISLPPGSNAFDFASISDLILHLRYTARAGSPALADAARANLDAVLPQNGFRLLAVKNEFGDEWHRFFQPADGADQTLGFSLTADHLPFFARGTTVRVTSADLFVDSPHTGAFDVRLAVPGAALPAVESATPDAAFAGMPHLTKAVGPPVNALGEWTIQLKTDDVATFRELAVESLRNLYLVVHFTAT